MVTQLWKGGGEERKEKKKEVGENYCENIAWEYIFHNKGACFDLNIYDIRYYST